MSGLCGWIGSTDGDPPDRILARMAAQLPPAGGSRSKAGGSRSKAGGSRSKAGGGGGLHLAARAVSGLFHGDDRFLAAIHGDPYWARADFAGIAAAKGHAAALVEAYRTLGCDLFDHLRGDFSLALIDVAAGHALVAIDRAGIGTMCYAPVSGGGLVFGSTTECLIGHPRIAATVSPQAIFNYLRFSCVPGPGTVYEEQRKLLPGQYLHLTGGAAEPAFYWRMPYDETSSASPEALAEELRELMRKAVRRTLGGDDGTSAGAFLSGGLDSSTIAGLLSELGDGPARTFTVGFAVEGYDETGFAHIAAQHFATDHLDYRVTEQDLFDLAPRIAESYDEPFANSSAVPAYYCARAAHDAGVTLMLAGDGGDEIFAGNERYGRQRVFDLYGYLPRALREGVIEPLLAGLDPGGSLPVVDRARRYVRRAGIPLPERLESYNYYASADLAEVLDPAMIDAIDADVPAALMREVYDRAASTSPLHRMMHLDLKLAIADNDLRKVNRMCALAGVRVRYPFLDQELMEFSARVPPGLLLRGSRLRHFFKRALADFLPAAVIGKSKHGFDPPDGHWLKSFGPLRELAFDSLQTLKRRGFLKPAFIDRLIDLHRTDDAAFYGNFVWNLMMLELWLERHPGVGSALPAPLAARSG